MLVPLIDEATGQVALYDIFVDGKWIGSRRTLPQAIAALGHHQWPSAVLASGYKIVHERECSKIIFDHDMLH